MCRAGGYDAATTIGYTMTSSLPLLTAASFAFNVTGRQIGRRLPSESNGNTDANHGDAIHRLTKGDFT
jgi:hypothetical protein